METYSDAYQDIFTLKLFNNTPNGYFLDIGCSDGVDKSNTLILERHGWKGILFDIESYHIENSRKNRKSPAVQEDVSKPDVMKKILLELDAPKTIDYISLDIDQASLICLQNFPLSDYRFKFMTFEHDLYSGRPDCIDRKNIAPQLLQKFGYVRIANNVLWNNMPYEDWFVDPLYFDMRRFDEFINRDGIPFAEIYAGLK